MVKIVTDNNENILIDPAIVIQGKDGKDGLQGPEGLPGRDGVDGRDGKDGKDGRDGIDGKDGKDGISFWIEYDKKNDELVFKNDGGKKNPASIKLSKLSKAWGFGVGKAGGGQVQADWNQTDKNNPTYIKNKPAVHNIRFLVVEELPTIGDPWTIYLIQEEEENMRGGSGGNIYSEWIFVENEITHTLSWEQLGTKVNIPDPVVFVDWS